MKRKNLISSLVAILVVVTTVLGFLVAGARPQLGLDLQGGISAIYSPVFDDGQEPENLSEVLDETIEIVRSRVDSLGVAEPDISRQGTDVLVQLPGLQDADRAQEIIGTTAQLSFRPVVGLLPPGAPGYAETPPCIIPDPNDPDAYVLNPDRPAPSENEQGVVCGPLVDQPIPPVDTGGTETPTPNETATESETSAETETATTGAADPDQVSVVAAQDETETVTEAPSPGDTGTDDTGTEAPLDPNELPTDPSQLTEEQIQELLAQQGGQTGGDPYAQCPTYFADGAETGTTPPADGGSETSDPSETATETSTPTETATTGAADQNAVGVVAAQDETETVTEAPSPTETATATETATETETATPTEAPTATEPATPAPLPPPADGLPLDAPRPLKYQVCSAPLTGDNIEDARPQLDSAGGWATSLDLDGPGGEAFGFVTAQLACDRDAGGLGQFAIVLDDVVESAPGVNQSVPCGEGIQGGQASITVGGSDLDEQEDEAQDLSVVLRTGALPLTLEPSTFETVSPTLGAQSLRNGLLAGIIGLLLVAIYLIYFYRLLGVIAITALTIFGVLMYGTITLLGLAGFALTLPGIAGIIVSIGITADSSILFFERIRDEVGLGKTMRSAVTRSFESAFRTNLAGNTVTATAAVILYLLAVGPVRGFALTLGLATVLDIVILYFFSRPVVGLLAGRGTLKASGVRGARTAPLRTGGAK